MKKPLWLTLLFVLASPLPRAAAFSPFSQDVLDLVAEPASFSPNGDGIQEQVFLSPFLKSDLDVVRWRLDIRTKKGKVIRRIDGASLPAQLKWDGKNKNNQIVPDGAYVAHMQIEGKRFKAAADSNVFLVDDVAPVTGLSVSTPVFDVASLAGNALTFKPTCADDSPIDRWQIQVVDPTGRTVYVFAATGTVRDVPWDGRDPSTGVVAPPGQYRCAFQAWDLAGNGSEPVFTDLVVNVTPREMLENVLKRIGVTESDLGLIVQLKAETLFTLQKGKPRLRKEATPLLKEVAILMNAYPKSDIRLDGYANHFKNADQNRSLGSLYAWGVYSYLVKDGHVKASRVKVRGRGRSAMFNRRAVQLPVIADGVEVILEGKDW
jgi:outer membrane protein OmpA-like peptidoglycan-associated protein